MKRLGKPSRLTVTYGAAWAALYVLFVVALFRVHGWAVLAVGGVYMLGYFAFSELHDRAKDELVARRTITVNVTGGGMNMEDLHQAILDADARSR